MTAAQPARRRVITAADAAAAIFAEPITSDPCRIGTHDCRFSACACLGHHRGAPCTLPDEWALFDQVRALKVHDDEHACWVPPVIGWWDQTGRTHCLACPPEHPASCCAPDMCGSAPDPIHADNSAAIGCACDFCGAGILAAALTTFGSPA